ncbi:MAG: DUF1932 domain-containing protein [Gammaproteobacteria bacterium]|nr:DUF1932 domain-containing protein [Gammaproteobacteria bacterium]MYE82505.1 DUF1932 domain-containing protein [Gammaproteobacteria bacterium]
MYEIGFIGFGEAAAAFVAGWRDAGRAATVAAYDLLFDDAAKRPGKLAECRAAGVTPLQSAERVRDACARIVSAVTPDEVLAAARSVTPLREGQACFDIASAAPKKKRAAAAILGDGYVDVAVMAPVLERRHGTAMLVGGRRAAAEAAFLAEYFPSAEVFSDAVGDASLVKMIRSVFVKGLESIAVECTLAASRAGVTDTVFPSLDRALRFDTMRALADYTLERVAVHGQRRGAEMDEVCETLRDLGVPSAMSAGSAATQKAMGALSLERLPRDAERVARAALEGLERASGMDGEAR